MRDRALRRLARLHGVQVAYEDWQGRRRNASDDALRATLAALGVDAGSPSAAKELERAARIDRWERLLEPVVVAWAGRLPSITIRHPAAADDRVELSLRLEDGSTREWAAPAALAGTSAVEDIEGTPYTERRVPGPGRLPLGRHRLTASIGGRSDDARVLAAPRRAPTTDRSWGVFAPIHALRSAEARGVGDFADLAELAKWVAERGGAFVATLPPLASFLDDPFEPSPYAPVSRLFWNELYVRSGEPSPGGRLDGRLVDYRQAVAERRPGLERMATSVPERELEAFVSQRPEVERYARFRAAMEAHGAWPGWPTKMRDGRLDDARLDRGAVRRYLAWQWAAERQLAEAASHARLLLDLPLGVHPESFDTWAHRRVFALGISAGAPPDELASGGQDWGFPPPHPQRIREDGHAYLAACVANLVRHASAIRIDHVMSLHRLYWVPSGLDPTEGAYVRYPREELYATLCLEAHRAGATLVGEDLGTVPREVRTTMARRGLLRSYVAQTEVSDEGLRPVPEPSQAAVNTHDLPTFSSFWSGNDIDLRVRLGLQEEEGAGHERKRRDRLRERLLGTLREGGWLGADRAPEAEPVLRALLRWLAASDARLLVVALDDLVGETEPHNVPGTSDAYPNWRRRMSIPLEDLRRAPGIDALLAEVDRLRSERR